MQAIRAGCMCSMCNMREGGGGAWMDGMDGLIGEVSF